MKNINVMDGADPFILTYDNQYYLFFTSLEDGFKCYSSSDLISWKDEGYALKRGEGILGDKWYWAPEIIYYKGLFYMVYVANEHLSIATSKSPKGPYYSNNNKFLGSTNMIDGHFFLDDDGKMYLFYVKFENANVIYMAEMNEEMNDIKEETERFVIRAEEPLEIISGYEVAEGPFILKHNNKYYLTYSCNHYISPYYAIFLATSDKITGPYVKVKDNPILKKDEEKVGVGHHSFFYNNEDHRLMCVYHRHHSLDVPNPRCVCITEAHFDGDKLIIEP